MGWYKDAAGTSLFNGAVASEDETHVLFGGLCPLFGGVVVRQRGTALFLLVWRRSASFKKSKFLNVPNKCHGILATIYSQRKQSLCIF